jgi:TPR repeat protein
MFRPDAGGDNASKPTSIEHLALMGRNAPMGYNKSMKLLQFIREPVKSQWHRARWRWPLLLFTVLSGLYAMPQVRQLVQVPVSSANLVSSADRDTAIQSKGQQALDLWKKGGPDDFKKAYALFEELAKANEPDAQFMLGFMHMEGQFVPKSDTVAAVWFRQAAELGHPDAQFNLAQILQDGDGVTPDDSQAAKWFGEAAKNGNKTAAYNLGLMFYKGRGVEKNDTKAATYYQQAVDGGHIAAHHNLGLLYKKGQGVSVDYKRAVALFQVAADAGYAPSQTALGAMYAKGLGVQSDVNKATYWFSKAAAEGDTLALEILKKMNGKE